MNSQLAKMESVVNGYRESAYSALNYNGDIGEGNWRKLILGLKMVVIYTPDIVPVCT